MNHTPFDATKEDFEYLNKIAENDNHLLVWKKEILDNGVYYTLYKAMTMGSFKLITRQNPKFEEHLMAQYLFAWLRETGAKIFNIEK